MPHAQHHSKTAIVGHDVEIVLTNPLSLSSFVFKQLLDLNSIWYYFSRIVMFSTGKLDKEHRECVPPSEARKVVFEARMFFLVYAAIVIWAIITSSVWPILMFLFPRVAGAPIHGIMLATQHIGFAQNVKDHRRTTRTMKLNPLMRFLYWNMNYHVEHHMYPQVPFHALPKLHNAIAHDTPKPTDGVLLALIEMFSVIYRQRQDPNFALPADSQSPQ
ncbi:MAG: fatty acid desaturase [Pseudomonadota bacterium]